MVWNEREEEVTFLYSDGRRIGSWSVGRKNDVADGHAAMRDETLHYIGWESREAIMPLNQR
jgi:hypothetical protein